jgi:hypothetical protein
MLRRAAMKHHLAIAAIFRNENAYLEEWLEYHLMVGFDHFYLYDNDGSMETREVLAPYFRAGVVSHHPFTWIDGTRHDRPTYFGGRDKNHVAFGHAARHYRHQVDWMMKIDVDEFLVPLDGDSIADLVDRRNADEVRCIRIPRIDFGHDGHHKKPDGLVLASYTRRQAQWTDHKDLANARFLSNNDRTNSAHSWGFRPLAGGHTIRESDVHDMRVHHYYTKSFEEYMTRQNTMRSRPISETGFEEKNATRNQVRDECVLRFVPEVERRIECRRAGRPV